MSKNQLLIELPTVLEGAVLFNVNNRQDEVFLKLLEKIQQNQSIEEFRDTSNFIEKWHANNRKHPYMFSNGCGCEYCTKTREYANTKLVIHRMRAKLDNDWAIYPSERYKSELVFIQALENKLNKLIEERKELRIHLGFISKRVLKTFESQ
jgi:hypothetical protein